MEEWKDYINYIFDGDALLFLGAGFSRNNYNLERKTLPLTDELSGQLQKASGLSDSEIDKTLNVQSTSEYLIEEKGEDELVKILKETFTVSESFPWQNELARLNWKRIYTSNYDNVFEVASNSVNIHRVPINIASKAIPDEKDTSNEVVHLNGFVDNINAENLSNSTKLTSLSYTDTYFLESPWRNEFDIDLEHSKAIFFIGFSLDYDLDLKRLISSNREYRKKTFFINGVNMNNIKKVSLSKFGNIIPMTGEEFSNYVSLEKQNYIPPTNSTLRTLSFNKSKFGVTKEMITDQEIADMLFSGSLNRDKLYAFHNSSEYIVKRFNLEKALSILKDNKLLMVHGKLGNGKTFFLQTLECKLVQFGYTVYTFNGNPNNILDDMEKLKSLNEKVVIIIDDYYSIKSEFRYFSRLSGRNFKFILSSRTSINDNIYPDFVAKTNIDDTEVFSINIDRVDSHEIDSTLDLLSNHNLWGKKASLSVQAKRRYLQNISKSGFRNIALEIVKSNNIVNKIYSTYKGLPENTKDFVILLLINNLIKSHLSITQLQTLTKSTNFSKKITENHNFKEFVDIENNNILIQSGIASQEILRMEKDKNRIINLMKETLKVADRIDSKKTYEYLKRSLVSFSNFKLIIGNINETELNTMAVDYFEGIKNINFTKKNPFFWLQYGIQKLDDKNYILADIFFDNALSYADKRGFSDFYQINAQKARGIIENIVTNDINPKDSYTEFEKAHKLLISDLEKSTNKKDYQLGQGQLYELYYSKYYTQLDINEKLGFKLRAKAFKTQLDKYFFHLKSSNHNPSFKIVQSIKALQRVLNSK